MTYIYRIYKPVVLLSKLMSSYFDKGKAWYLIIVWMLINIDLCMLIMLNKSINISLAYVMILMPITFIMINAINNIRWIEKRGNVMLEGFYTVSKSHSEPRGIAKILGRRKLYEGVYAHHIIASCGPNSKDIWTMISISNNTKHSIAVKYLVNSNRILRVISMLGGSATLEKVPPNGFLRYYLMHKAINGTG